MKSQQSPSSSFRKTGVLLLIAISSNLAMAQEGFRVETDIFAEGSERPVAQTLSLFLDGIAYDLPREPGQDITMVEPGRDRIIRLHPGTKLMCIEKISRLESVAAAARAEASAGPLAIFLAGAKQVVVQEGQIRVGASPLQYEATFQKPGKAELAKEYASLFREFADASKLLNSLSSGGDPPFARLALNQAMQQRGVIPKEIKMTVERGGTKSVYTCRLHANWTLSRGDRQRIQEVNAMLVDFEKVNQSDFNRQTQSARLAAQQSATPK